MMLTRCSGLSSGWKKKGWGRRELQETAAWVTLLHGIYASYRGAADLTSTLLEPLATHLENPGPAPQHVSNLTLLKCL